MMTNKANGLDIRQVFRVAVVTVIVSLFLSLLFGWTAPSLARQGGIVVSDNEMATRAGMEILERGGNAVDAAVATAFALGVVDPASSGIGGGGFLLIYQARQKKAHALDFRETAPQAARSDLYMKGGKPLPTLSLTGPLAVAVPGTVAGLTEAWRRFGSLPLPIIFDPAIRHAVEGFPLHPSLRNAVESQLPLIRTFPDLARVFLKRDEIPSLGQRIFQPQLAESLKAIADRGAEVFYQGWIAQAIAERIKKEGGVLTLEDLRNYKPVWREPLIGSYRKRLVITTPPPSSGGVALLQMLNVIEGYLLGQIPHNSSTYVHLLAEAMKHAFSDRAKYLGDPDFVPVPVKQLISKEYASGTRTRISSARTFPPGYYGLSASKQEQGGTTHFGVLDDSGNAVSASLTINTQFGSKILVPGTGIILNNEMDDFSVHAGLPNVYGLIGSEANSLQPKKRPLSSMTPTIILQGDRPLMIVGGSGGPRIISATLQTILNVLDFQMPVQRAVESPRIHHQWMPDELAVESQISQTTRESLERRGHKLKESNALGVIQAVLVRGSEIAGFADPRKVERSKYKGG
jgi:gamma-glutamyltranspeptidase/glutathione hydrolase